MPLRSIGRRPPSGTLDILALAPLPCSSNGRPTFQLGGSLYCVWLLVGLAELGHRVRAMAVGPRSDELQPGSIDPRVSVDWFAVEPLDTMQPPHQRDVAVRSAQFESALNRALEEGRPDLVVLGNEHHAWYAADICREQGLPTVLFAHGVPTAAIPTGTYPSWATERLVTHLRTVDLIVTVSDHLEAILTGLGLAQVRTIRTGIDTTLFAPTVKSPSLLSAHAIGDDRVVIGFVGHVRPEKRLLDIVAAAEIVIRSDPRALFLVVGDGPSLPEARQLVARMSLDQHFRFAGEVEHSAVPAHMALCDVIVQASEREGFGLVVREAQASERAVIVPDIPALRELVEDGQSGYLFPVGDVEALAATMLRLTSNAPLRRALGTTARAQCLAFSKEAWITACADALVETACARDAR